MCGIVAYAGKNKAYPILINGLKKLEYRGYDSAGIGTVNGAVHLHKREGKVNDLVSYCTNKNTSGSVGLGHTRWATHGCANHQNAHPHQSQSKRLTLVHNGIIENYEALKRMLEEHNFEFESDTDSEVLVQLVEWYQLRYNLNARVALGRALQDVQGSYAVVLHDSTVKNQLLAARSESPLVIGLGEEGHFVSSDAMTFDHSAKSIVYLEEQVIAELCQNEDPAFYTLDDREVGQDIEPFDYRKVAVSKEGFESYTLKEIFEQNLSVSRTLNGFSNYNADDISQLLKGIERIIITACGTSWHSGIVAEYLIEKYAHVNVEVEYASEMRYKCHTICSKDLVIGISQSGETADTKMALEIAKSKGAKTLAIVNGVNSSIARISDQVIYLKAGMEIGVASTKAFTSQLSAILMLSILISKNKNSMSKDQMDDMILELKKLPSYVSKTLTNTEEVTKYVANQIVDAQSALFLGRGLSYPIAIEGALKLKEISYIHAEGYPSGEMKHGPIALVEENLPVVAIVNNDDSASKIISNIQEVKARKAMVVVIKNDDVELPKGIADHVINVPAVPSYLNPIIQSIPLQLLAYYTAKLKGCNIDQPRNLAKSVTVE